jgi:hypothetical protein
MADNTILIPAAELAAKNKAHFPNESPNIARLATISFPRRSSSGATSSASQHSAASFLPAVKSRRLCL